MSAAGDRGRAGPREGALYERKERLTRTDLWAWEDAVQRVEGVAEPATRYPVAFDQIVEAMRDPGFYPGAAEGMEVEVHETHISWVFLVGDHAYKLKKPVRFPFLDYGSPERRRAMCEREVALNRRLAGDLYVGVRGVARRSGRLRLTDSAAGAVESVVEMRRFDETQTLAAAIAAGRADEPDLADVGRRLASFHAAAPARYETGDALAAVKRAADGTFAMLLDGPQPIDEHRVLAAQRFTDAFLGGHAPVLRTRAAAGLVREGHGDLRAEHVLLGDPVRIVDCAEFDVQLREVDVGADLAFLVMDLMRLGRSDLSRALVDGYRAAGGDPGSDAWIAFHAALRAWVRAKVALARAGQPGALAHPEDAVELFALGERLTWQAREPLTIIVCGPPASGKSHLARGLAARSGRVVLSSDETRKGLAGLVPTERAPEEAYSHRAGERTYTELGRLAAERVVADRGGVIVDATFRRSSDRRAFATAFAARAPSVVVECRAPGAILQARALTRESEPGHVSDAGPVVAGRLREQFDPLEDDVFATHHLSVRTDQPPDSVIDDVVAMLDRRLAQSNEAPQSAAPL